MEDIDIIKRLSIKHKLDQKVVKTIISHPFIFANKVIEDDSDETTIMFRYLGKFRVKNKFKGLKHLSWPEFLKLKEK